MRDVTMSGEWRTVQLFLDDNGVCEVEVDSNDSFSVRCNCNKGRPTLKCAHVKYVKENMQDNDGNYSITIPVDIDDDQAIDALDDPAVFRAFIIKYGKVLVL